MTIPKKSVAVVILNWNGEKLLPEFLPSVVANSGEADVVVIDNGSSDNSLQILQKSFPSVRVVELAENFGFAGGYNKGLENVEADYFVLLNSDVEVPPHWLDPVIFKMNRDETIAIAQPKILSYRDKTRFEYAGGAGGMMDKWGYPFCRGRLFDTTEIDDRQYNDLKEIFWASGAAFFVRSKVFHDLGGFDEDFFAHQEEIDLCWRAKNKGHRVCCIPDSKVYHLGGASLNAASSQKTFLNFRNSLAMIWKNSARRGIVVPIRLVLDGIAGVKFLLNGRPRHFLAVIRAHFAFYASIGKWSRKRSSVEQSELDLPGLYNGSIVKQYFLNGKKKFQDL